MEASMTDIRYASPVRRTFCLFTLIAFATSTVWAQDQPTPDESPTPPTVDLPAAETILDAYVEATGGKKAYEKLKTRTAKGTFEIASLGVKGKIQTWQQAPDKL